MNGKKTNLRTDTVAVSHVIGVVLMTAIFVTMLTIFQASMVPLWNKQVEADHIPAVYDDMTSLSSDIADSASRAIAKSSSIQLGARYPDRMIFRNPGPGAFGTLTVENDVAVNVECTDVDGGVTSRDFSTSRITYDLTGTVNSPKLVYEHGIIIREWDDGTVLGPIPPENHTLFDDCSANVYIPIVHGSSHSASSLDSKLVSIFPFSESEIVTDIVSLTITLDTEYPEVWQKLFDGSTNTKVTASVSGNEIKIESIDGVINKIYLPVIDDVISSDLYVGVITATATMGGGLWVAGEGTDIMSIGSRVANIPSSAAVTAFTFEDILVDQSQLAELQFNFISVTVTDDNLNWWKLIMQFQYNSHDDDMEIMQLDVVRKAGGGSVSNTYLVNGNPIAGNNPLVFTESTVIDLLNELNFDAPPDALYQNANIESDNRLVTNIFHKTTQNELALIFFRLRIDGA